MSKKKKEKQKKKKKMKEKEKPCRLQTKKEIILIQSCRNYIHVHGRQAWLDTGIKVT